MEAAQASREIGRVRLFASDRMDFVTEGEDENGHKCWRTYVGMAKPDGRIAFYLETLAYSPPDDWNDVDLQDVGYEATPPG